jgi:putative glutamine amidotransferase
MWSGSIGGLRFAGVAVAVEVLRSIDRAGGEPVILFPASSEGPSAQVGRVDGLVLPGGSDVNPRLYGEDPHPSFSPASYEGQDAFEAGIIEECLRADLPLLAICRGMQLLNVIRGGSLRQHLEPSGVEHLNRVHPVDVVSGSLLSEVVAGRPEVVTSSYHHQAVARLGEGLRVAATARDGVPEALELPGRSVLAVQWHPEDLAEGSATDNALFRWVVERAAERALSADASRAGLLEASA